VSGLFHAPNERRAGGSAARDGRWVGVLLRFGGVEIEGRTCVLAAGEAATSSKKPPSRCNARPRKTYHDCVSFFFAVLLSYILSFYLLEVLRREAAAIAEAAEGGREWVRNDDSVAAEPAKNNSGLFASVGGSLLGVALSSLPKQRLHAIRWKPKRRIDPKQR
jgi:hypothetical protein